MISKKYWIIPSVLIVCHILMLFYFGMNLPFLDEWDYVGSDGLVSNLSWKWLVAQHNEHRIVPTKLIMWCLYHLDGWSYKLNLLINFAVYLAIYLCLTLKASAESKRNLLLIIITSCFLLSPINYENHLWAFESQIHFALLFYIACNFTMFGSSMGMSRAVLGAIFGVLSIFSMSFGVVMMAVSIIPFNIYWLYRDGRAYWKQLLVFNLIIGSSVIYWFTGYSLPARHPHLTYPWTLSFWDHFLNILSLGYGYTSINMLWGLCALALIIYSVVQSFKDNRFLKSIHWITIVVSVLASLMVITAGRANFGIESSKWSRYSELGMIVMFATQMISIQGRTVKAIWPSLFCLFVFLGYLDNWNLDGYAYEKFRKEMAINCINENIKKNEEFRCLFLYYDDLGDKIDFAEKYKFSFVSTLGENK